VWHLYLDESGDLGLDETGNKKERAVQALHPPAWSTDGWERRKNLQRTYRSFLLCTA
jgi:hypothetical protein